MPTLSLGIINEPVTERNDDYPYTSLISYADKNPNYIPIKHVDPIVNRMQDATITDLQYAYCGCTNIFSPTKTKRLMTMDYRTISTEMTGFDITVPDYSTKLIKG